MIEILNKENCCACFACFSVCPQKCIEMRPDSEGFLYPKVDNETCIRCGRCIGVCPILNKKSKTAENSLRVSYALINQCAEVRRKSSSGGAFYALAKEIIQQGGVVFGAQFDEKMKLVHRSVDDESEIWQLMGAKYVQSEIGEAYLQAKKILQCGRMVMFVGTPCQIGGLRAYLGREYDNLLCVDIICHGVPSPKLWEKYLTYQEGHYGANAKTVFFRDKSTGWRAYSMKIVFENGAIYTRRHEDDGYMRLFLNNLCLRPSCHNCNYKSIDRCADITIADCWGAERVLGTGDDDGGISLLLLHTNKGKQYLDKLNYGSQIQKVDMDKAIKENPSAIYSTPSHILRNQFFSELDKISFCRAVKKYVPKRMTFKERLALFLKKTGIWKLIKK